MANRLDRTPPQNLEAEQSVLGGILIDNQAFHRVVDIVDSDSFYRPAHQKIYQAMTELASKGDPIDVVTLTTKLKELSLYEEVGGAGYLAELLERVPTAVNAEYHARLVAEMGTKRGLITTCNEIGAKGYDPGESTEELMDFAEKSIFALASSKKKKTMAPIRDIVRGAFQELEKRFENQGKLTGVPSGYHELDKMTSGFQRSDLIIVACRPSMGKTSFSLGAARHAAINGFPVVFFSLEMSKEQIVTRLLAAEAKVDQSRLRSGKLTEQDWSRLTRAAGVLSEAKVYVEDTPALTVLEVRAKARRLKAELGDLGLVVVDYLQIMGTPKHAQSRENAISEISRGLKALAKELDVPVIALSQLNRQVDLRQDKRPLMADLRESGAIEQDADIIIFIHRDDLDLEAMQNNTASVAEFIIGKHRNGPRGNAKVAWVGQYASFENLAADSIGSA